MSDNLSNDEKTDNYTVENLISHDSEYDDALGVPDSLEITINDNDETINPENKDDNIDSTGKPVFLACFYPIVCYPY